MSIEDQWSHDHPFTCPELACDKNFVMRTARAHHNFEKLRVNNFSALRQLNRRLHARRVKIFSNIGRILQRHIDCFNRTIFKIKSFLQRRQIRKISFHTDFNQLPITAGKAIFPSNASPVVSLIIAFIASYFSLACGELVERNLPISAKF